MRRLMVIERRLLLVLMGCALIPFALLLLSSRHAVVRAAGSGAGLSAAAVSNPQATRAPPRGEASRSCSVAGPACSSGCLLPVAGGRPGPAGPHGSAQRPCAGRSSGPCMLLIATAAPPGAQPPNGACRPLRPFGPVPPAAPKRPRPPRR